MASNRTTIYIPDAVKQIIGKTGPGELSARIAEIIERYGEALRVATKEIQELFSDEELVIISNINLGTIWQPASTLEWGIHANCEDAEDSFFADEAQRKTILEKTRSLTYLQSCAIVERIRRIMSKQ